ncbi:hypothetical protein E2562_033636 [Oryza meyeriana var. granulata]|uniref:Uncharacterized protein n=1 Tax=Oryza meyeriana var. granulata TaxID=110450 RepID=A0A6G1CAG0_9ORYZ|nr:hypothetical protein E2562_033636 [Oryza meyeriana var. granulata]
MARGWARGAAAFAGAAALVFGFLPGVACVFSAKVLGASLSFWIGRCSVCYSLVSALKLLFLTDAIAR